MTVSEMIARAAQAVVDLENENAKLRAEIARLERELNDQCDETFKRDCALKGRKAAAWGL